MWASTSGKERPPGRRVRPGSRQNSRPARPCPPNSPSSSPPSTRRTASPPRWRRSSAFPDARVLVADDGSRDATATPRSSTAPSWCTRPSRSARGASPRSRPPAGAGRRRAAGGRRAVRRRPGGERRASCRAGGRARRGEGADLAIAVFARRVGGGFGVALGFSRWATRELGGVELAPRSPASGRCAARSCPRCCPSRRASGWRRR